MNKKSLMISLITIIGVLCILVGSIAYYRITVSGNIKGSTGNAVFNVTGFTNESTKEIVLKEGKLVPGDKGSFTLSLDATSSEVDMYVTLTIDRGTLPTNLKFYTTSDYKSELHKYYEFMDTSDQSKDITIYWYWNPYIDDEEDSSFINKTDLTATVNVNAVQISEYAMMKNGVSFDTDTKEYVGTEFWDNSYRRYIRMINFINDLSNLPEVCNDENLCWDVSYISTQSKKVYAYLIDSGLDLYNLYIASEAPIFAPPDCSLMFANFRNLETINFNNNFNTSYTTDMTGMFGMLETNDNMVLAKNYFGSEIVLLSIVGDNDIRWNNSSNSIVKLDLSSFNTTNVANMQGMFAGCSSLTSIDLSNFNASNVTDMSNMFAGCLSLINLDVSSFNTSNVTDMSYMFYDCNSLTSIDLSSFNTSKVANMSYMFRFCIVLTSLDLSNFNTSNVTSMKDMFYHCESLTSLDLSSFNTLNVTDMSHMFYVCSSLTSLDLSSFNTSNVTDMTSMFGVCTSLSTTINIMNASVTSYSDMFFNAAIGAQITVNYIADASELVDNMIATKSGNSNVVKGVQI